MEQRHNGAGAATGQPDYSGLQVVPVDKSAFPEPVSGPFSWKQEGTYAYALTPGLKPGEEHGAPEVAVSSMPERVAAPVPPSSPSSHRPWWRRKRWILVAILVAVLIVVGAVVGGVVGTRSTSSSPPSPPPPSSSSSPGSLEPRPPNSNTTTPQRTSACRDALCPQILAAAVEEAGDATTSLHLFARGVDRAVWHTSAVLSSSSSSSSSGSGAPSYAAFTSFFAGPFASQPAALAWGAGTADSPRRVGVFAVADPDHGVRMKTLQRASASGEDVGGPAAGPVAVCLVNGVRPDLWTVSVTGIAHNFGYGNATTDSFWSKGRNVAWQGSAEFDTVVKGGGRPGVVCRQNDFLHDVVVYGEADGAARHSTWSWETGWTRSENRGGRFQGEPLLVGVGNDRFDFFGVGEDRAMYHFVWTVTGGFTALENLGGSFASVPSAAVTSGGRRVDVVALGTSGTLQHRVLRGLEWAGDWEDLGVFANSAPLLVNVTIKSTGVDKVGLFVIGRGGEVNQTLWTASSDLSWRNLVWTSLGGNMTTDFLR